MVDLMAVKGPRDLSIAEVKMHISNLRYQLIKEVEIYDDVNLPAVTRTQALSKMERIHELLDSWQEVENDLRSG